MSPEFPLTAPWLSTGSDSERSFHFCYTIETKVTEILKTSDSSYGDAVDVIWSFQKENQIPSQVWIQWIEWLSEQWIDSSQKDPFDTSQHPNEQRRTLHAKPQELSPSLLCWLYLQGLFVSQEQVYCIWKETLDGSPPSPQKTNMPFPLPSPWILLLLALDDGLFPFSTQASQIVKRLFKRTWEEIGTVPHISYFPIDREWENAPWFHSLLQRISVSFLLGPDCQTQTLYPWFLTPSVVNDTNVSIAWIHEYLPLCHMNMYSQLIQDHFQFLTVTHELSVHQLFQQAPSVLVATSDRYTWCEKTKRTKNLICMIHCLEIIWKGVDPTSSLWNPIRDKSIFRVLKLFESGEIMQTDVFSKVETEEQDLWTVQQEFRTHVRSFFSVVQPTSESTEQKQNETVFETTYNVISECVQNTLEQVRHFFGVQPNDLSSQHVSFLVEDLTVSPDENPQLWNLLVTFHAWLLTGYPIECFPIQDVSFLRQYPLYWGVLWSSRCLHVPKQQLVEHPCYACRLQPLLDDTIQNEHIFSNKSKDVVAWLLWKYHDEKTPFDPIKESETCSFTSWNDQYQKEQKEQKEQETNEGMDKPSSTPEPLDVPTVLAFVYLRCFMTQISERSKKRKFSIFSRSSASQKKTVFTTSV